MEGQRATIAGFVKGRRLVVEVSGDLWDAYRDLRHVLGTTDDEMLRQITDDGSLELSEPRVEQFVGGGRGRRPYSEREATVRSG